MPPCTPTLSRTNLHLAGRALLIPATVVAEVGYLLERHSGPVLDAVADGDFELVDLTAEDARRAAALVRTYADMPLGTTDATVIAVAERLGISEVTTPDRRHFTVFRPAHTPALMLLP